MAEKKTGSKKKDTKHPRIGARSAQRVPIPKRYTEPDPAKWYDRQPEEQQRAWQAFCTYRDQGPTRSAKKVAEALSISQTMAQNYQMQYRWVERIRAWQADQDAMFAEARAEHLRDMAKRQAAIAIKMQKMVWDAIRKLESEIKTGKEALKPKEAAYWLKVATDVERVAMGAPPRDGVQVNIQQNNTTHHNSPVSMTQEERLAEIKYLAERRRNCGTD